MVIHYVERFCPLGGQKVENGTPSMGCISEPHTIGPKEAPGDDNRIDGADTTTLAVPVTTTDGALTETTKPACTTTPPLGAKNLKPVGSITWVFVPTIVVSEPTAMVFVSVPDRIVLVLVVTPKYVSLRPPNTFVYLSEGPTLPLAGFEAMVTDLDAP